MDRQTARQCFERGAGWALANAEGLSPDARFSVLAGLLLADPERAESARGILRPQEIRLSGVFKVLDLLTLKAVSRRMEAQRRQAEALFDVIERDPSPLAWPDLDSFRHVPKGLPGSPESMHRIDGAFTGAALAQAGTGRLEEPVLAWLRREDLWGYDLAHQLLAWAVCIKAGCRTVDARERAGRLSWRLFHEIRQGPPVHYDLFAERLAFLLLAGFPREPLTNELLQVVSAQDPGDGGWWFTRVPADQASMLKDAHLGSSPLVRPAKPYQHHKDPEETLRRVGILHRGHATGLSLWALGFWLKSSGD